MGRGGVAEGSAWSGARSDAPALSEALEALLEGSAVSRAEALEAAEVLYDVDGGVLRAHRCAGGGWEQWRAGGGGDVCFGEAGALLLTAEAEGAAVAGALVATMDAELAFVHLVAVAKVHTQRRACPAIKVSLATDVNVIGRRPHTLGDVPGSLQSRR